MLSDEEKKAIDNMKSLLLYSKEHEYFSPFQEQEIDDMNIVLNLIEKQQKEIEELKNADLTTVYLNGVYDGEKKEYEELKSLLYTGTISQYGKRKLIDMFEKQQKEIEELKEKNKPQPDCAEPVERTEEMVNMRWVNYNYISKDKIKAKIEEINEKLEYGWESEYEYCKEVLQSLLEKEE